MKATQWHRHHGLKKYRIRPAALRRWIGRCLQADLSADGQQRLLPCGEELKPGPGLAQGLLEEKLDGAESQCGGLSECIPCVPSDDAATFANCTPEELASGAAQCSKAFGRYFTRPRGNDRREVLVCHGNVIRYFICRALGIAPEIWGRLNSHNCGISAVTIYTDGFMMVESYNDVGHLPEQLLTRT